MKRGVLYLHWGSDRTALDRSTASLKTHHPELPVHVETLPATATLLDKASMFDRSPFEETCFLDHDTVVLGRLDFGFAQARRHGLACCICENPWARRYGGLSDRQNLVEYNTGVIFWVKNHYAKPPDFVFHEWSTQARKLDSSILFYAPLPASSAGGPRPALCRMPYNDQAAFALAIDRWEHAPAVLPLNWNFRPAWHRSWWGPIVIWHDYSEPPAEVLAFTTQQQRPGTVVEYRTLG